MPSLRVSLSRWRKQESPCEGWKWASQGSAQESGPTGVRAQESGPTGVRNSEKGPAGVQKFAIPVRVPEGLLRVRRAYTGHMGSENILAPSSLEHCALQGRASVRPSLAWLLRTHHTPPASCAGALRSKKHRQAMPCERAELARTASLHHTSLARTRARRVVVSHQ